MSLKRKIVVNTFVQFAGRFATSFLGFLTTIIIARVLGASGYGSYAKAYTLVSFFYLFVDFGLNAVYIRKYKQDLQHFPLLIKTRRLFFTVSVVLIAAFLLLTKNIIFTPFEKLLVFLFTPTIFLFGYQTSLNTIFQLRLRYDLSVLASLLGGSLSLLLVAVALYFPDINSATRLLGVSSGVVVGYVFAVFLAFYFARRISPFSLKLKKIKTTNVYKFVKEALAIGAMLFLNSMYVRVDILVLAALKGNIAVGVYQLAYKFFEFPLAFATFFANSIFPHYINVYNKDKYKFMKLFKKTTLVLLLVAVVFSIGGALFSPLLRFIKSDYQASVLPLWVLSLSYPVFFLTSAFSWLLFIKNKEIYMVAVYALSFTANLIANLIFVPKYSYLASAWITVFTELLVLCMLILIIKFKKSYA